MKKYFFGIFIFCLFNSFLLSTSWADVSDSGSYTYSIPMDLPPGINGAKPNLSFDYNSSRGLSTMGLGWKLKGIPKIERMNWGNGINYQGEDTYVSDKGRLVSRNNGHYHTIYESWSQYTPIFKDDFPSEYGTCNIPDTYKTVEPCAWQEVDRNGNTWIYGGSNDSRVAALNQDNHIRQWHLSKFIDVHGNFYKVDYTTTANSSGVVVPSTIYYSYPGLSANDWQYKIHFIYSAEEEIPDVAQGTFTVNTGILQRVEVRSNSSFPIIVTYFLDYYSTAAPLRIQKIRKVGYNGTSKNHEFEWTGRSTTTVVQPAVDGATTLLRDDPGEASQDLSRMRFGDFNGDGRTDIYYFPASITNCSEAFGEIWLGQPDGTLVNSADGIDHCSSLKEEYNDPKRFKFIDLNGDGRTDIYFVRGYPVQKNNGYFREDYFFLANSDGSIGNIKYIRDVEEVSQPKTMTDGEIAAIRFTDFDGDGLPESIRKNPDNSSKFNIVKFPIFGSNDSYTPISVTPTWISGKTYIQRHLFGDFNGDGRTDIYFIEGSANNGISHTDKIYLADENGGFAPGIDALETKIRDDTDWRNIDVSRIKTGDFNGDGLTDIYYMRYRYIVSGETENCGHKAEIYLSNGDGTFNPTKYDGLEYCSYSDPGKDGYAIQQIKLGDFDGDGRTDVYKANHNETDPTTPATDNIYLTLPTGEISTTAYPAIDTVIDNTPTATVQYLSYSSDAPMEHNPNYGDAYNSAVDQFNADLASYNASVTSYNQLQSMILEASGLQHANLGLSQIVFGDFNGDGKTDIYYVKGNGSTSTADDVYLSTIGSYLLKQVTEPDHSITYIDYRSIQEYPKHTHTDRPTNTITPSPRMLVSKLGISNGRDETEDWLDGTDLHRVDRVTTYSYEGGALVKGTFENRKDLGFSKIIKTQHDQVDASGNPIPTKTIEIEFYQDANTEYFGRRKSVKSYWGASVPNPAGDPDPDQNRLLESKMLTYQVKHPFSGWGNTIDDEIMMILPDTITLSTRSFVDNNGIPSNVDNYTTNSFIYDGYGRETERETCQYSGNFPSATDCKKITTDYTYWTIGSPWPIDLPQQTVNRQSSDLVVGYTYNPASGLINNSTEQIVDKSGNFVTPKDTRLSITRYKYRDGRGNSNVPLYGIESDARLLLYQIQTIKCDNANDCYSFNGDLLDIQKEIRYDQWGHIKEFEDAAGNLTKTTYTYKPGTSICNDQTYLTVTKTAPLTSLITKMHFNNEGRLLAEDGVNSGDRTCYTYDPLGRIDTVENSLGGKTEYKYHHGNPNSDRYYTETIVTDTPDHVTLTNGAEVVSHLKEYRDGFGYVYRVTSKGDLGLQGVSVPDTWDWINIHRKEFYEYRNSAVTLRRETSLPTIENSGESWIITQYDVHGRKERRTRPEAPGVGIANVEWDYFPNKTVITQRMENTSSMYNESDTQITTLTETLILSPRGKLLQKVDNANNSTTYRYDGMGRLIHVALPSVNGEAAQETWVAYNSLGQKTELDEPSTGITSYTYDDLGNLTKKTDGRDASVNGVDYTYDVLNRLQTVIQSYLRAGTIYDEKVTYDYDLEETGFTNGLGRLGRITVAQKERSTTSFTDQFQTSYYYDIAGNLTKRDYWYVDGPSGSENMTYSKQGRLNNFTFPDAVQQKFAYTSHGNLSKVWLDGEDTLYESTESEPLAKFTHFDEAQRFRYKTLRNDAVSEYSYDPESGRLESLKTTLSGTKLQDLQYDFNTAGFLKQITDQRYTNTSDYYKTDVNGNTINTNATQTFRYDQIGRLAEVKWDGLASADPDLNSMKKAEYDYDPIGNLRFRKKTFFDGSEEKQVSSYTEQQVDKINSTENVSWEGATLGEEVVSIQYDDATGNMIQKTVKGTKEIWVPIFVGNITTFVPSTTEGLVTWDYVYDGSNRIIAIKKDGKLRLEFVYDHVGQRIKKTFTNFLNEKTITWYISSAFEIRQDSDGNLASSKYIIAGGHGKVATITIPINSWEFAPIGSQSSFDPMLEAPSVEEYMSARLAYGGLTMPSIPTNTGASVVQGIVLLLLGGLLFLFLVNRYQAHQKDQNKRFITWRQLMAISTVFMFTLASCAPPSGENTSNSISEDYTIGSFISPINGGFETNRLSGTTVAGLSAGIFYYHANHIGSSAVITSHTADLNGSYEVSRIAYTPFGEIDQDRSVGVNSVTHKFTGQELDEESDLYYYGARYYDPSIGRFLTADTFVPDPSNLQSFNRYAYVLNNPIIYNDPTGHIPNYADLAAGGATAAQAEDEEYGHICDCGSKSKGNNSSLQDDDKYYNDGMTWDEAQDKFDEAIKKAEEDKKKAEEDKKKAEEEKKKAEEDKKKAEEEAFKAALEAERLEKIAELETEIGNLKSEKLIRTHQLQEMEKRLRELETSVYANRMHRELLENRMNEGDRIGEIADMGAALSLGSGILSAVAVGILGAKAVAKAGGVGAALVAGGTVGALTAVAAVAAVAAIGFAGYALWRKYGRRSRLGS